MHIEASGFIGAAMAVQGIRDATVVLHGQNGCRKGLLSGQDLLVRTESRDSRFYGKERSIPYSNIRPEDYYKGTIQKLEAVMEHVGSEDYALKVVMCSPGISLVGDDCRNIPSADAGMMVMDTDELPPDCPGGFDSCICGILDHLSPQRGDRIPNGVNIIGLSIMHKDWASYCHELSHLLKDAGFRIVCVLGAGCSVGEISDSVNASYNIVVDPSYAARTAGMYEERYGIPSVSIGECPIGYDAIGRMFRKVGEVTGVLPEHGMGMLRKSKRRAYEGIVASGKSMRGRTFAIVADESTRAPLKAWLEDSFGMVECEDRPDYLFAPGNIALLEQAAGGCGRGVDIGFPSSAGSDFLKKPLMGLEGCMYILDALFNRPTGRTPLRGASSPGCVPCGCPCP
jgi:nitrogenase molybdenum-iron protein alpha/beta subunit